MSGEPGRIVRGGMGGFLNPPTHPEHDWSVQTDLRRRPEDRGMMSLSCAATCEWLSQATRDAAQRWLDTWQAPPIDSPEVVDWIHQVLGYFRTCWRGPGDEPECWHAENLRMGYTIRPEGAPDTDHAGVHLIRQYYPEFLPSPEDWAQAYWGTKPEEEG